MCSTSLVIRPNPSILVLLVLTVISLISTSVAAPFAAAKPSPSCRFSPSYSLADLIADPEPYISDLLYWEGGFAGANGIGFNATNGLTYDGTLLDHVTGYALEGGRHEFSAASKESLHVMLLVHALHGSSYAARVISPDTPSAAPSIAFSLLSLKLSSYLAFNATYPGYGGYLPWYAQGAPTPLGLAPTWDWVNRVPALDNGELLWAVAAAVEVLNSTKSAPPAWAELAMGFQGWLDYTKLTAARIFYNGTGEVCAVTSIVNDTWTVDDPRQGYVCQGSGRIDDPYEGELFTWWLYLYGGLPDADREMLWVAKRPHLIKSVYNEGGVGPIDVQEGWWFSAHEQWKVLELPYYDVTLIRRLYANAERVRTCNSAASVHSYSGMFASVNSVTTNATQWQIAGYVSDAGIPPVSNQTEFELDLVTPYSVFPTLLFNKTVGLAWWKNMVDGNGMQNPYGSTESTFRNGTAISSFISWDSKVTTINALLGGVSRFTRAKLRREGLYAEFIRVARREYNMVFGGNSGRDLAGSDIELCYPTVKVPSAGVVDYTSCA